MIEAIWNLLTTLTQEAQQAAVSKCVELGYDQDRGRVSLAESYINLDAACNILRDAIEKKKLIQLPITIQDRLLVTLESVSKAQTGLAGGTDEVVNLVTEIERLNTAIWQYGLHNLSDEVLGYQTKLNQLKSLELAANQTTAMIQEGIRAKEKMDEVLAGARTQGESIRKTEEAATNSLTSTNAALDAANAASAKASETLLAIQATETAANDLRSAANEGNTEIQGHRATIKGLVTGFTTLNGELEANKATQEKLFAEFEGYRKKIDVLLGDANRTGMAASFTDRRRWLIPPLILWGVVFAGSIGALTLIGLHYIEPLIAAANWEQVPAKLALTAPIVWLGWFAAKQYGYTTRLREDYAYKEASAKSFEGYKREAGVDAEMLKRLMETAIQNLGHNPIRVYNGHENHASPVQEVLEKALKDERWTDILKGLVSRDKR